MKLRRLFKVFKHGEKGFTLIELLVVVAILGILAAVVIPNVMGMMGSGRVEAANTEAHDVEIAVLACMVKNNVFSLTAGGTVGPTGGDVDNGSNDSNIVELSDADLLPYINGLLHGVYTLGTDGSITAAAAASNGKWVDLTYDPGKDQWEE
ncbi:MAG: prepilin-type N-terminal cleavage/methylation domain-containing protein [Dehalococcoidia bacterium]|nr:MAG: prepilin-type N-terminal cleavage/methylation domain-containing protein [Dehalococcoidia bacterium]